MKKHILSFLMALFCLLTLIACNKNNTNITTPIPAISTNGLNNTTSINNTTTQKKDLKTININLTSLSSSSQPYETNFNNGKIANGIKLGGYRIGAKFSTIYPYHYKYIGTNYEGIDGAIYNVSKIDNIYSIELSYSTSTNYGKSNAKSPYISFGTNMKCSEYTFDLEPSTTFINKTIDVSTNSFNFFSVNTGDYLLNTTNLKIEYTSSIGDDGDSIYESGKEKYRINPIKYTNTLVPGVSKITIPTAYEYQESTNTYISTASKIFTYYTTDYVKSHPECVDDATIVNPLDVCIYYTTFGTWPANYSTTEKEVKSIFGSNSRRVSQAYTRTDGYVTSIPWNGNGVYYELDIDFDDTYSFSSRGTGRVVVWPTGWNSNPKFNLTATDYDDSPVCVYTNDHYNTWLEYLNNGTWSNRFNAEGNITGVKYSPAKTINLTGFDSKMI